MSSDLPVLRPSFCTRGWGAVAALGIGAFALVTTEFLPVGLLPQMSRDLRVSEGVSGLMVTLPGLLAAISAPLIVAFAGGVDRRHLLAVLMALLVLSNVLVALSESFSVILAGRVVLGIAVGSFWTIGGSLGPRLVPGPGAARATAIILSGVSIGTVAGVPAGALLGELVGWRWAFGAASLASVCALALLLVLLPSLPADRNSDGLASLPTLLRRRSVQLGLAAVVLLFGGHFAAYTYIGPFLLQFAGIPSVALGAVLLGYGVAGFVGNMLGGWTAGKSIRSAALAMATVLGASILLLALLGHDAWSAVPWVLSWGIGFGMLPIAMQSWMFAAATDKVEAVQAVFVSLSQAAIGAGSLIGGLVADHIAIPAALLIGAFASLLTAGLMVLGPKGSDISSTGT